MHLCWLLRKKKTPSIEDNYHEKFDDDDDAICLGNHLNNLYGSYVWSDTQNDFWIEHWSRTCDPSKEN